MAGAHVKHVRTASRCDANLYFFLSRSLLGCLCLFLFLCLRLSLLTVPVEKRVAIITIERNTGVACKRMPFPIVQASAVTIHKSQGATYTDVVYKYNHKYPQKLVYVALSRCTDVDRLFLTNPAGDFNSYHGNENVCRQLIDEFHRLDKHHLPTITKSVLQDLRKNKRHFILAEMSVPFRNTVKTSRTTTSYVRRIFSVSPKHGPMYVVTWTASRS
ncbi:hypothetical protein HPB49_022499 [Dermacentor silvarum]|uniref:Uncharacterized protein n=1 Tax=Dermacentor silvarum TaxID=543639 RepID=A0ACB8CMS8_DERSI|nr:hypothetical protein HPB49_022499 [Dermacentor silvarum]